ncbi:hypothetical protein Y032_0072g695 [Ancylostoma ceylanicum]|uniref:Uncharacterized protein n=1 Tax=Ancylostoma ceylanicum TaxID=53326 RepID=A0A016TWI7_9BILA|nr:hypothetical protein Y032_0072g695 [Ancylostoma ceylanicum]
MSVQRQSYCSLIHYHAYIVHSQFVIVISAMFGNVIDKIVYHVRNSALNPWRSSKVVPPTPRNSVTNLADLKKVEPAVKPPHDYPVQFERRVYKRSDPIDIVRPKVTW